MAGAAHGVCSYSLEFLSFPRTGCSAVFLELGQKQGHMKVQKRRSIPEAANTACSGSEEAFSWV